MNKLLLTLGCLLTLGPVAAQLKPDWPAVTNETKAGSRWWWLGSAVDHNNLKWNMEQYAAAGLGTLEISPIYGVQGNAKNNIGFLTTPWLDMLRYTSEQGRQLSIDIDMIMGTGWPFGGPMLKPEETASRLVTETVSITGDGATATTIRINNGNGVLQRVLAYPQTGNNVSYVDLTAQVTDGKVAWTAPEGQWKVITVYCKHQVMAVKRPSPGSEGYALDHFDADAVASYLSWFDARFEGAVYPRSFFNDSYEITGGDWTRSMFESFEHYRGYKLESVMDKLLAKDRQVMADYRQTLDDMLLHNFTEPWTAWAHRHGVTTRNQAHGSPGNLIDLYAAADIPETESFYLSDFGIKGLRKDPGYTMKALSSPTTLKYASSAAHVTGKSLVSSETMTWLTEHFRTSLSQMKPELDQLFAAGVNHILFHGTCYSPREASWPGWKFYAAVDMSPTNSIWRDAPAMLKYIERVQSFLQMGSPDNEVLVYAPFVNAMHKNTENIFLYFDINKLDTKMPEMVKCVTALTTAGYDCDYISDRLLMGTTCEGGLLKTAAGVVYRSLIVPISDNMPADVKTHLDELAAQGARIVYGYDAASLGQLGVQPESMRQDGLRVLRRKNDSGYHYFVANLSPDRHQGYYQLAVPFASAALFNPLTGEIRALETDGNKVWLDLRSGESLILQTYDTEVAMTDSAEKGEGREVGQPPMMIGGPWRLSFTDDSTPAIKQSFDLDRLQTWEMLSDETARLMGTGIYETTFNITALQMSAASGGFLLNLGDVRESARVWLNGQYLGCLWSVPFVVHCGDAVKEGLNTLRIEVTNLPANRIRQMDADGIVWRIFEDANINVISGSDTFANWQLVPSGLNSYVSLIPLGNTKQGVHVRQSAMHYAADDTYNPVYQLTTLNGQSVKSVSVETADGKPFDGAVATVNGNKVEVVISGRADSPVVVTLGNEDGTTSYASLPAYGPFRPTMALDFTAETAPGGGWMKLGSTSEIMGFSGSGKLPWYRSTLNGKLLTDLYPGLTFSSEASNYYFYFPGYGMVANNDFTVSCQPPVGTIIERGYLVGEGASVYNASDSLVTFHQCVNSDEGITIDMPSNKRYHIYRSLAVYEPMAAPVGIGAVVRTVDDDTPYYNIMGQPVNRLRRGIYIHHGKKVVVR